VPGIEVPGIEVPGIELPETGIELFGTDGIEHPWTGIESEIRGFQPEWDFLVGPHCRIPFANHLG